MKSKRLFQLFILFVLVLSPFGTSRPVYASTDSFDQSEPMIINRNLNYWDATYFGFVSSSVYEKWQFEFTASHNFIVTVVPITGDLVPLLILQTASGTELARGTRTLNSTQPAGDRLHGKGGAEQPQHGKEPAGLHALAATTQAVHRGRGSFLLQRSESVQTRRGRLTH